MTYSRKFEERQKELERIRQAMAAAEAEFMRRKTASTRAVMDADYGPFGRAADDGKPTLTDQLVGAALVGPLAENTGEVGKAARTSDKPAHKTPTVAPKSKTKATLLLGHSAAEWRAAFREVGLIP